MKKTHIIFIVLMFLSNIFFFIYGWTQKNKAEENAYRAMELMKKIEKQKNTIEKLEEEIEEVKINSESK